MGTACIYLVLLAVPLAQAPTVSDPFLPFRTILLGVGLTAGLVAPGAGRLTGRVAAAMAVPTVVFLLAALASATPLLSLLGRYPRYEGLPMVLGYACALILGARLLVAGTVVARSHAERALVLMCLINAAVALFQWVGSPSERITGLLGNSTTLANVSLVAGAMLVWRVSGWDGWRFAGLAGATGCLVLSASRGALLGAVVAAAAVVVLRLAARSRPSWWWGPVAAIGLLCAAWLAPGSRARLASQTPFAESTAGGRLMLWRESWQLVADHPFLGVGPSRFVDSIGTYHTKEWAALVGPYAPPDSPHNVVLQVLSSTGWVGLFSATIVGWVVGLRLWRLRPWDRWQLGAVSATLALFVSYLTSFTDPVSLTMLLFVLGGAIGAPRNTQSSTSGDFARVGAAVIAVLAGLTLGGTQLVAEFRYSKALQSHENPTRALQDVRSVRPWDADLARRVGYTAARLAERGEGDAQPFLGSVSVACGDLPGSVECLHTYADLQDLVGDSRGALSSLARAQQYEPFNVDTLLRQGVVYARSEDYERAIASFNQAMSLRPTAPEPWDDLARVYEMQGRGSDAERARERAQQLRDTQRGP